MDRPLVAGELELWCVERGSPHVEDVAQGLVADGHGDRCTGIADLGSTDESVGGGKGDSTHLVATELLRDFADHGVRDVADCEVDLERMVDLGQRIGRELHVHDGARDLHDPATGEGCNAH